MRHNKHRVYLHVRVEGGKEDILIYEFDDVEELLRKIKWWSRSRWVIDLKIVYKDF